MNYLIMRLVYTRTLEMRSDTQKLPDRFKDTSSIYLDYF